MTLTLCLDTSDGVDVGLLRSGEPAAAARSDHTRRHVETLTPLITACLQQAEAAPTDVTEVAVGTGPAPFTGLRVGLITARTFAAALDLPVHGVCSLEAIAAAAEWDDGELLVATDARRREVYWGRYRLTTDGLQPVAGPSVASPGDLATEHQDLIDTGAVVGKGVALYPEILAPGATGAQVEAAGGHVVRALTLGRLARRRAAAGLPQPVDALYLRLPDIAVPGGRKRAS